MGDFMIKIILAISLLTSVSYAEQICSCNQKFKDFLGNESDVTIHVTCPNGLDFDEYTCDSEITETTFSASCANLTSEMKSTTTLQLDPMTKPTYSYTYCNIH